jgi:stage II sporulation protein E
MDGKDKIKCIENVLTKHCESKIEFLKDTSNISDSLYMQKYISEDKYVITVGISKLLSPRKELSSGTLNLKLLDNKQLVAISDSNEGTKSSKELLNILKHDLAAGFNDEDSLEVISSSFENSLEPIKASIDLFVFDLFKGEASYIKMGSNNTYVKLGDTIKRIESEKTIDKELNYDRLKLNKVKTENYMIFVMASRGVLEAHKEFVGDKWFEKIIKDANSNNCKKMAEMILERVISNSFEPINKDMYVITIKITNKTEK